MRVLEDARQADVVDDRLPVERILEVAQALVVLDARDVLLVRQHDASSGCATPSFVASDASKNLSSAVHMNGLLTTVAPCSTACLRYVR